MRVTSAFCRLLRLPGMWVPVGRLRVGSRGGRRRVASPACVARGARSLRGIARAASVTSRSGGISILDLAVGGVCAVAAAAVSEHGALVEGVPFARYGARFARDFEHPYGVAGDQDRQECDL